MRGDDTGGSLAKARKKNDFKHKRFCEKAKKKKIYQRQKYSGTVHRTNVLIRDTSIAVHSYDHWILKVNKRSFKNTISSSSSYQYFNHNIHCLTEP